MADQFTVAVVLDPADLAKLNGPLDLYAAATESATVIGTAGRTKAPRRSGRLASSITVGPYEAPGTHGGAQVSTRLVYAAPIEFGWPRHHIEPAHYLTDAASESSARVAAIYEQAIGELLGAGRR